MMKSLRKKRGFTLIELIIVMAIIAILAAVAMPAYDQYVRKGKRGEGISAIQTVLEAQERFYADNRTYTDDLEDLNIDELSPQGFYRLSADTCTGTTLTQCVEITAAAQGSQAADGDLVANTRGLKARVLGADTLEW